MKKTCQASLERVANNENDREFQVGACIFLIKTFATETFALHISRVHNVSVSLAVKTAHVRCIQMEMLNEKNFSVYFQDSLK